MKKTVLLFAALSLCFSLCACQKTDTEADPDYFDRPEYYQDTFEPCHSTSEHIRALYSYDLNNDNHLSEYELELFSKAHPRFVNDKQFIAWVEENLVG